jgi:hypothetical protein
VGLVHELSSLGETLGQRGGQVEGVRVFWTSAIVNL